jgi:hypothetical protein
MNRCTIGLCVLVMTALSACGDDDVTPGADAGPSRCAPPPSGDTRWAQYPMPGTPGHPRSYQVMGTPGAETVIDCVTGLEWQRTVDASIYTQAEAITHCDRLTLAGYADWRLPARIELVTLVDYSTEFPAIDATAFPVTPGESFWSASSVAGLTDGCGIDFSNGAAYGYGGASDHRVRCVRGNDAVSGATGAPPGHFTDLGDGTVRDNPTGLIWQQGFSPSTQSQAASVAYCSTLTVPTGSDWRLPTVAELQTLVDESVVSPSIDTAYFPSTPPEWFWSSSPLAGPPSFGWFVYFTYGGTGSFGVADNGSARCVR